MLPWLCGLYAGECLVEMPATFAATACTSDLRYGSLSLCSVADVLPVYMMNAMMLLTQ